jgi:DNA-binding IclR family transcriptional regulator
MRETGETILVLKRFRDSALCIASSVPNVPATISFTSGHLMPLERGAGSKLLLACAPQEFRQRYLEQMHTRGESSAYVGKLRRQLENIGKVKFSQSSSEVDEGIFAVAAPIMLEGRVIAALSIAGLEFRLTEASKERLKHLARTGAAEVSQLLAG